MYPYNFKMGQKIQTDVPGVSIDRFFGAHIVIEADDAVAADLDGVAIINLSGVTQDVTSGITDPAVPRGLSIDGNVAGIAGNVVITGTNYADEEITETIALNGTSTVHGAKAFKEITEIAVPVQTNTPVAQVETATVVATITEPGNADVTVTAAGMTGSPKTISVPVEDNDDANAVALAIRTVLAADEDVIEMFVVSGATDKVILTAITPATNDATLNIAVADDTCVGITPDATSDNTTAGVPYDIVSVGWNDIIGLPYKLERNTVQSAYLNNVLEGTAPTVVVDSDEVEKNTVDLNSALDGTQVDIYLYV